MNESDKQVEYGRDVLKEALRGLKGQIESYKIREEHWVADLVLAGYALSAWDCAMSVQVLLDSTDLAIGGFVAARAALEASEDAALLASEADFDEAGARARLLDHFEYTVVRNEWAEAFPENQTAVSDRDFEMAVQQIEQFAAALDQKGVRGGEDLRRALEYWRPRIVGQRPGRLPLHWFEGGGRRAIAREIAKRRGNVELEGQLNSLYRMLSRYSHPRMRQESWRRVNATDGRVLFQMGDRNREQAGQAAVVAVILLRDALKEAGAH